MQRAISHERVARLARNAETDGEVITRGADGCCAGNREHPRPNDALGNAPAHRRERTDAARADDGSRNGVCRGYWNAEATRDEERDGAAGFRANATHGLELGDSHPHRANDAPAA